MTHRFLPRYILAGLALAAIVSFGCVTFAHAGSIADQASRARQILASVQSPFDTLVLKVYCFFRDSDAGCRDDVAPAVVEPAVSNPAVPAPVIPAPAIPSPAAIRPSTATTSPFTYTQPTRAVERIIERQVGLSRQDVLDLIAAQAAATPAMIINRYYETRRNSDHSSEITNLQASVNSLTAATNALSASTSAAIASSSQWVTHSDGIHYTAGNVGIGTTTPSAKLAITGTGASTGIAFRVADSSNVPTFNILDNGQVTLPGYLKASSGLLYANGFGLTDSDSILYTKTGSQLTNSSGNLSYAGGVTLADGSGLYYSDGDRLTNGGLLLYGDGVTKLADFGSLYYAGGGRLTSNGGSVLYYGDGVTKLADSNADLFYGSGTKLASSGGSLWYSNGFKLADGDGKIYDGYSSNSILFGPSHLNLRGRWISNDGGDEGIRISDAGSVGIGTSTPTLGPLVMASGAHVTAGGTWTNASDRGLKENFTALDPLEVLGKIEALPISRWNYKNEGADIAHIGPAAQDFHAAFAWADRIPPSAPSTRRAWRWSASRP